MPRHEFSAKTKGIVSKRADGRCENHLCRAEIQKGHFDHIIPCGRGGDNSVENCQYLCEDCHRIKTRRDVFEIARNKRVVRKKKKKTPEFRPRRVKRVVRR
jgi:5-methylcytosine-specific restriction protein A